MEINAVAIMKLHGSILSFKFFTHSGRYPLQSNTPCNGAFPSSPYTSAHKNSSSGISPQSANDPKDIETQEIESPPLPLPSAPTKYACR